MGFDLDMEEILKLFLEESFEGLDVMERGLLELDAGNADPETINSIFRAAHSIKGGAATLGYMDVSKFTHGVETLLDEIRSGARPASSETVQLLLRSGDHLRRLLTAMRDKVPLDSAASAALQQEISALLASAPRAEPAGETRDDALLAPAAGPNSATPAERDATEPTSADPARDSGHAAPAKSGGQREAASIRVGTDKVDALLNLVGELVITQSMLRRFGHDGAERDSNELRDSLAELERHTRELQEAVMQIRMLPISVCFGRFPRLIRDLGLKLGKKVELKITGQHTELDKTVLENIADPLVHLVRNSLDHGIESPAQRVAAGKPETGEIHLSAFHEGGNIVIQVADNGAGLNRDRILAKARQQGLIAPDETPSDERIFNLIFQAGFSTAETVSDVSGRGVGMDVVRRNIKNLGGRVEVTSVAGRGATFTIRLPLTLAILDGQLVRLGEHVYVIPLLAIVETVQVRREQINSIPGRGSVYRMRNSYVPVICLRDTFGMNSAGDDLRQGLLMVVEADGLHLGLFVDELLEQQQVVIKSLEENFHQVDGLSGATILGDGRVALILDVPGLIHRHVERDAAATGVRAA